MKRIVPVNRPMTRSAFIALALIAAGLAGCGVRGSLETPRADGAGDDASKTASADSGQGKKQGEAQKPHQGFVLDRLLQ
jgi:predicted small lipoprotein YifL